MEKRDIQVASSRSLPLHIQLARMNDYELRRQEKIKKNQALLAELKIDPIVPRPTRTTQNERPAKRRKLVQETAPSRTSARIAAVPVKPSYDEDIDVKQIALPRSAPKRQQPKGRQQRGATRDEDTDSLVPSKTVGEIIAGWTSWKPTAPPPTRDDARVFHFADHPAFTPNKSPEEVLREGAFGGSYYRPLRSRRLGVVVEGDWTELPREWIGGLPVERYLTSADYDPEVNKFGVACGQSIEEWEAAGWIKHEHDVRGWFQWYTRFFRGRRCDDDERQVSRWRKCVGEAGRWRRTLLKKYVAAGVREVFDDGEDEEARQVSPVVHQTCHHWAFEVRQEHLDEAWTR